MFTPATKAFEERFREGLQDRGYVEGKNIRVEWRSADGKVARANALAAELARLNVSVIVAEFTPAVHAAKNATQSIPIVMAPAGDPVASGFVASYSHPGGNITGVSNVAAELSGKRLELLREIVPKLSRVGMLIHGADPLDDGFVNATREAAARNGIEVSVLPVPRADAVERAFAAMAREQVGALILLGNLPVPARQTAQLAEKHRLPTISPIRQFADAGGLMSYGANLSDIYRRAASHVDKILKGAKPAELPVERPTKFELVVNRKTARAIGVSLPSSLLLRADLVIE